MKELQELTPHEVYVLAILAQHAADVKSQDRLLSRLSDKALAVGCVIARKPSPTATDAERDLAQGFIEWARKLGPLPRQGDIVEWKPQYVRGTMRGVVSRIAPDGTIFLSVMHSGPPRR